MLRLPALMPTWVFPAMTDNENSFIVFDNVTYCYSEDEPVSDGNAASLDVSVSSGRKEAVKNISLTIEKGSFTVICGSNGSGKSTLAKLMNGLLVPTEGKVITGGLDTSDDNNMWEIRRNTGMVFQNPDNQIIATSVEEDVAFGLENIGVPREEMLKRVDEALEICGIKEIRKSEPHLLSGGQKQRVSIAGILAMRPSCIVLDESTAMLDPKGRKSVLDIIRKLNREENITIVLITHHMDEITFADKVIVMEKGEVVRTGTPEEIFSDSRVTEDLNLELPPASWIFNNLEGFDFGGTVLTAGQGVSLMLSKLKK